MFRVFSRMVDKLRGVSGETFVSFRPVLATVCRVCPPRRVLEFGPGNSTRVILKHSMAYIVSIEESEQWYLRYRSKFPKRRVEVHHKKPGWDLQELNELGGPYDLIFVDGGDRAAELKHCVDLLAPDGVVFLHDAHREEYEPGIRAYPHVFFPERHSCLLCTSPHTLARLKANITPDLSCCCRYCGTEERRRYLAQFTSET